MFLVSIPILIAVGYYNIHKVAKVSEQLSVKHGTHYNIKQFEMLEEQLAILKEIRDRLRGYRILFSFCMGRG